MRRYNDWYSWAWAYGIVINDVLDILMPRHNYSFEFL